MRGVFRRVELGGTLWSPTRCVDSPEFSPIVRGVEDDVVLAPRTTPGIGSIRKDRCGTAGGGNFFQLAVGEEADKCRIGRPKGGAGFFCAIEFSGGAGVQGLYPNRTDIVDASAKCNASSVGGNDRRPGRIADEIKNTNVTDRFIMSPRKELVFCTTLRGLETELLDACDGSWFRFASGSLR